MTHFNFLILFCKQTLLRVPWVYYQQRVRLTVNVVLNVLKKAARVDNVPEERWVCSQHSYVYSELTTFSHQYHISQQIMPVQVIQGRQKVAGMLVQGHSQTSHLVVVVLCSAMVVKYWNKKDITTSQHAHSLILHSGQTVNINYNITERERDWPLIHICSSCKRWRHTFNIKHIVCEDSVVPASEVNTFCVSMFHYWVIIHTITDLQLVSSSNTCI